MRRARARFASFAVILIVACSGSSTEGTPSISPETACNDFATAYCDRVETCAPFYFKLGLSSHAQCVDRLKINCPAVFTANGTSATPERLSRCATDAKTLACDDVFARNTPASCKNEPGQLADGAACGVDAQCKNKLCRLGKGSTCGACSTLTTAGGACERNEDCEPGLSCAQKKCIALGKAGAACTDTSPCLQTYSCVGSICTPPLEAGVTCTPALKLENNPCNFLKGLFCHLKTKVCTAIELVGPGSACGFINDTIVGCSAGDCKTDATGKGTCVAKAADGATCDDEKLPKCQEPARCANGVCKISNPADCK
jgi:hypothetical protein